MTESGSSKKLGTADTQRVMKLLPHRFPFLMVDRIIEMDRDESAVVVIPVLHPGGDVPDRHPAGINQAHGWRDTLRPCGCGVA